MATPSFEHPRRPCQPLSTEALIAKHNARALEPSADSYFEKVSGDFMEPYLMNGDCVLVDPNDHCLVDGIVCFEFEPGFPRVVRVQLVPKGAIMNGEVVPGGLRVFGDNPRYDAKFIDIERARLALMGRVRAIVKRV